MSPTFLRDQKSSIGPGLAARHCTAWLALSLALTSLAVAIFVGSALELALIPMLAQIGDGEQGHSFQFKFMELARSTLHLGSGCGREISGVEPHSDAHLGNH